MKKTIIALACTLLCLAASGADFYCSTFGRSVTSDEGYETSAAATATSKSGRKVKAKVDRFDVLQAYSGQPVLVGSTWLTACMLDPMHPDTRLAFANLIGVNADAAAAMARSNGLVDRGIRMTRDMASCLTENAPAVGYSSIPLQIQGVKPCF